MIPQKIFLRASFNLQQVDVTGLKNKNPRYTAL